MNNKIKNILPHTTPSSLYEAELVLWVLDNGKHTYLPYLEIHT